MDPLELEWTQATIEQYSSALKTAVHVFSHDLRSPDAIERTLRFAAGRLRWFRSQLPEGTSQVIWLDDRGQALDSVLRKHLRDAMAQLCSSVVFMSESVK